LSFDGAAQISVPGIALPTTVFITEGQPIPAVTAPTNSGATLVPYKLATITSLTGEMLRNSNAESLVRQVLLESVGPAVDKVIFGTAAAGAAPPGLLNGIAALTPATGTEKMTCRSSRSRLLRSPGTVTSSSSPVQTSPWRLSFACTVPYSGLCSSAAALQQRP
jgi:hypothetical protein